MSKTEKWVIFKLHGKEILRYTAHGTFAGELESTKELLAAQHKCQPEDITTEIKEEVGK